MTPSSTYSKQDVDSLKQRSDAVSGVDSSTFGEGVRLLPGRIQADIRRLYSVLRTIDDLVDEGHPEAAVRVAAVEQWSHGEPTDTPETRMLTDLARRSRFRRDALMEFCEGMRHDLAGAPIEDEHDLERYCQQAGGAVGVMLAGLLGTSDPDGEERMALLGRAMQRTNILRDIDEDYANGRVYIAKSTIERYGFPAPGAREALLRDQITRADALYECGIPTISMLIHGQQAMAVATSLYREILRQIERDGYGRRAGRVEVPSRRKAEILARRTGWLCDTGA